MVTDQGKISESDLKNGTVEYYVLGSGVHHNGAGVTNQKRPPVSVSGHRKRRLIASLTEWPALILIHRPTYRILIQDLDVRAAGVITPERLSDFMKSG